MTRLRTGLLAGLAFFAAGTGAVAAPANPPPPSSPPNVLFVIMDDVGIDQIKSFGYGGIVDNLAPKMPTIEAIAEHGVRFRNTWSMPECSNGRAALMTGRYPFRTNIYQAIGPRDLANSQLSRYDTAAPKLMSNAGYVSGLFGKFHLGGPENNQNGDLMPATLGWNHFYGWVGGLPGSIDTTAGGISGGPYSCGFVPKEEATTGACYTKASSGGSVSCQVLNGTSPDGDSVGLQCLNSGGILVPNVSCTSPAPAGLNFDMQNAHYVSPLVINNGNNLSAPPLTDPRARGFRATIEVNGAIRWIKQQSAKSKRWMATVSFSSDHTPLQPPPGNLLSAGTRAILDDTDCTSTVKLRMLSDAMIEAMDTELGRLLVETGIASRAVNGDIVYNPAASNTAIVIVGDNGTLGTVVKLPFDATRAKSTAYQTGVWVPLVVAGPMVASPDRDVNHMLNAVDVFQLFGEFAGLDARRVVPKTIDSYSVMPYLTNPAQASLRPYNFTQGGLNIQKDGAHNPPCVMGAAPGLCSQTPTAKNVCQDNGGVWWGPGYDDPSLNAYNLGAGLDECWQVNQAIYNFDPANYGTNKVSMAAQRYSALRNSSYKLVRNDFQDYDTATEAAVDSSSEEFYRINEDPGTPLIDTEDKDLLPGGLDGPETVNYSVLKARMNFLLGSAPACPGDGNGDGVVNATDVSEYKRIARTWGLSSTYDFNHDALTNGDDLTVIKQHMGRCPLR